MYMHAERGWFRSPNQRHSVHERPTDNSEQPAISRSQTEALPVANSSRTYLTFPSRIASITGESFEIVLGALIKTQIFASREDWKDPESSPGGRSQRIVIALCRSPRHVWTLHSVSDVGDINRLDMNI